MQTQRILAKAICSIFFLLTLALSPQCISAQNDAQLGQEQALSEFQKNLQLAREYYKKGEYEKALVYLEKLQKRHYNNPVYELSLNCYLALEDYREAEKLIEDYIKQVRGNNATYHADMVYIFIEQDKQSKADKYVDDLLNDVRKNPGLAFNYANAFQKRGFPKVALQMYQTAEEVRPSSSYDYQKALLYGELGEVQKMYTTYVEMIERSPNYMGTIKQLLGRALQEEQTTENSDYLKELLIEKIQKGGSENLNELLIFILIQEKNFNTAFIQLKALDRRSKGSKAEIYNLGRVAMNNEEYDLARRIFEYVIKAGDDFPFYESALVMDLRAQRKKLLSSRATGKEDWKSLQEEYFKILKILKGQPEVGPLTIDLAQVSAFQLDETDTAMAVLDAIINTGFISKEDVARAKIELADILLYTGNRWEAILYYGQAEKAFEQSPIGQEAKFKRAKAAYYVGDFQWALGIFDALKASTSKLIANDAMHYSMLINDNIALDTNTEAMAMYARADLMNYQSKFDSALIVLDMMDIAFPDHSIQDEVLYLKSEILTEQGRYEEAAQTLQTLVSKHEKDILADDALYGLAQLYELYLGRVADAQTLYQQLFTEHPDSFYASDARKRFRALRGDVVN